MITIAAGAAPVPAQTVAPQPVLLADLNTTTPPNLTSAPSRLTPFGPWLMFEAQGLDNTNTKTGLELFRTGGMPGTTRLVKDLYPGPLSGRPFQMTVVGTTMFFTAGAGTSSSQTGLWKTDGTPAGTVFVKSGVSLTSPVAFAGRLYFLQNGDLWTSDGTSNGTVVVRVFTTPALAPVSTELIVYGNRLYLQGYDRNAGLELWKSDGTAQGTVLVKDLENGSKSSGPRNFRVAGGKLYFTAADSTNGRELWVSDGTAQNTRMIKDVRPGTASPFDTVILRTLPVLLTPAGNLLYFMANDGSTGAELWRTDGTPSGTFQLKDIKPGKDSTGQTNSSRPEVMVAFGSGSSLLFAADDGNIGSELWMTDGTAKGTRLVKDIHPGKASAFVNQGSPGWMFADSNTVYFQATDQNGLELWKSDGTASGTVLVKDIWPGSSSGRAHSSMPRDFVRNIKGRLVFTADDGVHGRELWVTDGTSRGTVLLADILKPPAGSTLASDPSHITAGNGLTWLVASDGQQRALYRTDGTPGGTSKVARVNVGGRSRPRLCVVGDRLFFNADSPGGSGTELWVSDGTATGTRLVKDIAPGAAESFPEELTAVSGRLFFSADDGVNGRELWVSDGTVAGTRLVKDIFPGKDRAGLAGRPNSANPRYLASVDGRTVIFQATDGVAGTEVWRSDGTASGTVLVKDVRPGNSGGSNPRPYSSGAFGMTTFGTDVWFTAVETGVPVVHRTDGTEKGTVKVANLWVKELKLSADGTTLFAATDLELYKAVLPAGGTTASKLVLVKTISAAPLHDPMVRDLTVAGDLCYFTAEPNANANRSVLWRSDGTANGTFPVTDGNSQFVIPTTVRLHQNPVLATTGSRKVYFNVNRTLTQDAELWVSDGTPGGTRMVFDLWPGKPGSRPTYATHANGRLLFAADNGLVGNELWSLDVGGNAQSLGQPCAAAASTGKTPRPRLMATDPALGQPMSVRLRLAQPNRASVLAIGFPPSGPAPMVGTGASACVLPVAYGRPHILVFLSTGANGRWTFQLKVPNNTALASLYLVLHAAVGPATTIPFGLDLSNAVYLRPGS